MVRRTASGTCRSTGSTARNAATAPASTTSPRVRRLRRARALPYLLRFLPECATAQTPRFELLGLLLKFIYAGVVLYHHVGQPGLLLLRKLSRLYAPEGR